MKTYEKNKNLSHEVVQMFKLFDDWEYNRKEINKKKRTSAWSVTYLNKWKHNKQINFFFHFYVFLSHCFSSSFCIFVF